MKKSELIKIIKEEVVILKEIQLTPNIKKIIICLQKSSPELINLIKSAGYLERTYLIRKNGRVINSAIEVAELKNNFQFQIGLEFGISGPGTYRIGYEYHYDSVDSNNRAKYIKVQKEIEGFDTEIGNDFKKVAGEILAGYKKSK